jgi:hypothetical protein
MSKSKFRLIPRRMRAHHSGAALAAARRPSWLAPRLPPRLISISRYIEREAASGRPKPGIEDIMSVFAMSRAKAEKYWRMLYGE